MRIVSRPLSLLLVRMAIGAWLLALALPGAVQAAPPSPSYSVTFLDAVTGDNPPQSFAQSSVTCVNCYLPDSNPAVGNGVVVDSYTRDVYERPFGSGAGASTYYPALDLVSAQVGADGEYVYARLTLYGVDPATGGLPYVYGVELNFDADDRGDLLIRSTNPRSQVGTTFGTAGLAAYWDQNHNVGAQSVTGPDGPTATAGGYETLVFDQGTNLAPGAAGGTDALVVRIVPTAPNAVEFAIKRELLSALSGGAAVSRVGFRFHTAKTSLSPTALYVHDEGSRWSVGSPYPWLERSQAPSSCPSTAAAESALRGVERNALDSGTNTNTGLSNPCYSASALSEFDTVQAVGQLADGRDLSLPTAQRTATPTPTAGQPSTATTTPTVTSTPSGLSASPTRTPTSTSSSSPTATVIPTNTTVPTRTPTESPTQTLSPSPSQTLPATPPHTLSTTPTQTPSATPTQTAGATGTPAITLTAQSPLNGRNGADPASGTRPGGTPTDRAPEVVSPTPAPSLTAAATPTAPPPRPSPSVPPARGSSSGGSGLSRVAEEDPTAAPTPVVDPGAVPAVPAASPPTLAESEAAGTESDTPVARSEALPPDSPNSVADPADSDPDPDPPMLLVMAPPIRLPTVHELAEAAAPPAGEGSPEVRAELTLPSPSPSSVATQLAPAVVLELPRVDALLNQVAIQLAGAPVGSPLKYWAATVPRVELPLAPTAAPPVLAGLLAGGWMRATLLLILIGLGLLGAGVLRLGWEPLGRRRAEPAVRRDRPSVGDMH